MALLMHDDFLDFASLQNTKGKIYATSPRKQYN